VRIGPGNIACRKRRTGQIGAGGLGEVLEKDFLDTTGICACYPHAFQDKRVGDFVPQYPESMLVCFPGDEIVGQQGDAALDLNPHLMIVTEVATAPVCETENKSVGKL
jgi:hypothetical protein